MKHPKNNKISVGLVGCGRISNAHFNAIRHFEKDLDLTAVCDVDVNKVKQIAERYQVPGYTNIEAMLQETNPNLIVICTPSGLHAQQACISSSLGKHVITEKPMATRWEDGLRMVETAVKNNTYLFVVKQNRHNPIIQLLKKAIDQQRFGKIYLVTCNVFWARPQAYYTQDKWRGTWEFDGGAFMNQASHFVDLMDWLIGPVEAVQAIMDTLARDIEVEDTGVLNIRWRSGTLGSMSVTMLTYRKNLEGSLTIIGEKGSVKLGGAALDEVQHWEFEDTLDTKESIINLIENTPNIYGIGHIRYYKNVIKVLKGEEKPQTDGREGLRSLQLLIAAYDAKFNGATVHLSSDY